MTIFVKPIVNTKLNLKRNKYNEGRGSIPLPFIFLLRSPYTDDDYDAWVVWSGGAVRSSDYVYSSYGYENGFALRALSIHQLTY